MLYSRGQLINTYNIDIGDFVEELVQLVERAPLPSHNAVRRRAHSRGRDHRGRVHREPEV